MARRNIPRQVMEFKFIKEQLVDESLEERMARISRCEELSAVRWQHPNYAGNSMRLSTAYGKLEVWPDMYSYFVSRAGEWLVHARSPEPALFTRRHTAKVAGLVHVADGFGNKMPCNDGLWWKKLNHSTSKQAVLQSPVDFNVDISISDDHEWGQQRLNSLLKGSTAKVSAADENLVLDLEAAARSWQLRLPEWTKQAHGYYHLNTPYGHLVVRRLIGWTVERNGVPLTWFCVSSGNTVIFDKLEHAKTSALLHARDRGLAFSFRDGTRWREPAHTHHSGRAPFGSAG